MTASNWRKTLNNLRSKPVIAERFVKHNKPKDRKMGVASKKCERCERFGAHIQSYGLNLCRQCFREIAVEIGFKKYS